MKQKSGSLGMLSLLALSSLCIAGEPTRPAGLSMGEMDGITAGVSTFIINGGAMNIDTIGGSNTLEFPAEAVKVISPDTVRVTLENGETTISGSSVKALGPDGTALKPGDVVQLNPGESIRLSTGGSVRLSFNGAAAKPINLDAIRQFFSNIRSRM